MFTRCFPVCDHYSTISSITIAFLTSVSQKIIYISTREFPAWNITVAALFMRKGAGGIIVTVIYGAI